MIHFPVAVLVRYLSSYTGFKPYGLGPIYVRMLILLGRKWARQRRALSASPRAIKSPHTIPAEDPLPTSRQGVTFLPYDSVRDVYVFSFSSRSRASFTLRHSSIGRGMALSIA